MRKYKQVKEKKITFDMQQWAEVERRAAVCHTTTTAFMRDRAVNSEIQVINVKDFAPMLNGMRIISNNINQVAKKANEINSIYVDDVEKLKEEVTELSHTLSRFVSTLQWTKV